MFIVFDTNIWLSELALNSPSGAAVRFFIKQQGATVAVPEVVRMELEKNLKDRLTEYADSIRNHHRQLLAMFGNLKEVVLPTEKEIALKAAEILSNLDVPIREVPFSLEAARASLLKAIDKIPPSKNSQQFKDGVIWANCLDLLAEANVCLVTTDKAFYEDRNYKNGLAAELAAEAADATNKLTLMHSLDQLLVGIRKEVAIDQSELVAAFRAKYNESIQRLLTKHGFAAQEPPTVVIKPFATESASRMYVEFQLIYPCVDETHRGVTDAVLTIPGDGQYELSTGEFINLRNLGEKLDYTDEHGQQKRHNVVALVGSIVVGHANVHHTVKVPLNT